MNSYSCFILNFKHVKISFGMARKNKKLGDINPGRGSKGDFMQTTLMINRELYLAVKELEAKRRANGEKNINFSSITREALVQHIRSFKLS